MSIIKWILVIACAFASGWFTRGAITDAIERIYDWREPARWAVLGALCIVGLLVILP